MGDETWANIQLLKSNRERFREKIKKRKAERETLLSSVVGGGSSSSSPSAFLPPTTSPTPLLPGNKIYLNCLFRVKCLVILQGSSVWMFSLLLIFMHIFHIYSFLPTILGGHHLFCTYPLPIKLGGGFRLGKKHYLR